VGTFCDNERGGDIEVIQEWDVIIISLKEFKFSKYYFFIKDRE
jgi:hypothetical protein